MGVPMIAKDSKLAQALAKTLDTDVVKLAEKFHNSSWGDSYIDITAISKSDTYKDKVYGSFVKCGSFDPFFFVDNGDGKIGKGDLFLHSDGYYKENKKLAFRFVKVGKKYKIQKEPPHKAKKSAKLTKEADKILQSILVMKGKSFIPSTFEEAVKAICDK